MTTASIEGGRLSMRETAIWSFLLRLTRARDLCSTLLLPNYSPVLFILDHPRPTKVKGHMRYSNHKTVGQCCMGD